MTSDLTMENEMTIDINATLDPTNRMSRDLMRSGDLLTTPEARFLVDAYYSMQKTRIAFSNQAAALAKTGEPNEILLWFRAESEHLENQVKRALDRYSMSTDVGKWLRSVHGIGPVIAAGLMAHIDIERAATAGAIWRFAGLDPTAVWAKGQRRPWNAALKVICWKAGESFVKQSGAEDCFYGHVYAKRKALEEARNEAGEFADQAAATLEAKNIGKTTDAYKAYAAGKLPQARIHARAARYAVKLFLAGLHEVMYRDRYGKAPPLPYAVGILGHAHVIPAPGTGDKK